MKTYALTFLIFVITSFTSVNANTQVECHSGWYINGIIGENFLSKNQNNFDVYEKPGLIVGGSIGYKLVNGLRFEGEFSYRTNTIDFSESFYDLKAVTHTVACIVNSLYDFKYFKSFIPYIGIGYGYSYNEASLRSKYFGYSEKFTDHNFKMIQFIAGFSVPTSDCVEVGLEGRYLTDFDLNKQYSAIFSIRRYF